MSRHLLLGAIATVLALSLLSGGSRMASAAGRSDVNPPRAPRWKVSPAPARLAVRTRTFFLELGPAQGSLIEVVEDAGDANHDGFRDVLVWVDRPDQVGRHRRQFILVLGGRKLLSSTLDRVLRLHRARLLKGPNPILPKHGFRAASNVGDVDGDGRPDVGALDIDRSEAQYNCGGDSPPCVQLFLAARLTARSSSGHLLFDHRGGWVRVTTAGPYPDHTFGWVGDWNRDGRSDVFEADLAASPSSL